MMKKKKKKKTVTRLWATVILLGGAALAASPSRLEAQAAAPAAPSYPLVTRSLLDKASGFEAHGRIDLAAQTWQQVLLTDPNNREALGGLARAAKLDGNTTLTNTYLDRLRAINPDDPDIARVQNMTSQQNQTAQLQLAAKLAEAGKYAAAMAIYVRVYGTNPPPGDWSLAYYETEAATEAGRPQAIAGLRALVEKYPSDSRYQISLGRILTYNPKTREEGQADLQRFPWDQKAAEALRQSLLWDAANPEMAPRIQAYLATHRDPQLAQVLQAMHGLQKPGPASVAQNAATATPPVAHAPAAPPAPQSATHAPAPAATPPPVVHTPAVVTAVAPPPPAVHAPAPAPVPQPVARAPVMAAAPAAPVLTPRPSAVLRPAARAPVAAPATNRARAAAENAAYQALNAKMTDVAEMRFKAILAGAPDDPLAIAGMGYVRMQQGNFSGAISYLEQARHEAPADQGVAAALDTARFWFIMGEGQIALNANDLTTAERRYRAALDLRPDSPEALDGLGGTLLRAQQPGPAIQLFERAVQSNPADSDGWRGLFLAQLNSGNAALALATDQRLPAAVHAQLMSDPLFLRSLASAYSAVGRDEDAQKVLESALALPLPADAKGAKADTLIQFAGMMLAANRLDQAAAAYREVLAVEPTNAPAWEGLVQAEHAMGHDAEAMQTAESIPPGTYAAALRDPGFVTTVVAINLAEKKLDIAQDLLQKAIAQQAAAGLKPSAGMQMELANVYLLRGEPQLAYPIFQQVLTANPNLPDAWAGLLSALHVTGHNSEAVAEAQVIPVPVRVQLEANLGYLRTMASIYGALGQSREAALFLDRVEQNYAAQHSLPPAEVEIENAWLLYNGMDEPGLYRQLMALGSRPGLTDEQRRTVQTIWTNWAVRRANQDGAAGDMRRALAILNAAAGAFPDNPVALRALANGYIRAGQAQQAVAIYKEPRMVPANAADSAAAIGAALAAGDNKDAGTWLRSALASYPADPQILILAAKFEQGRGNTARAIAYYRASLKAMPPSRPGAELIAALGLPGPLSLSGNDQAEQLAILLAPGSADPGAGGGAQSGPYLPSYGDVSGRAPAENQPNGAPGGTTDIVPPYMSNPPAQPAGGKGKSNSSPQSRLERGTVIRLSQADVEIAVRDAAARILGTAATAASSPSTPAPSANPAALAPSALQVYQKPQTAAATAQAAVQPPPAPPTPAAYGAYVPYVQPSRPANPQNEDTEAAPTLRSAPNARASPQPASHPAPPRAGQSNTPATEPITAVTENAIYTPQPQLTAQNRSNPQVTQPTAPPYPHTSGDNATGGQQYPQPRAMPGSGGQPTTAPASGPARRAPGSTPPSIPIVIPQPIVPPAAPTPSGPTATDPGYTGGSASGGASPVTSPPPIGTTYPLPPPPSDAELTARTLSPLGGASFAAQAPLPGSQRQEAEAQLASLEGVYSSWAGGTGIARYRIGSAGLDQLYDLETPAEASMLIGQSVRLSVIPRGVFLNSGNLNPAAFSGQAVVPYLGTVPASAAGPPAEQVANGIGGELQLTTRNFGLAAGYTPYEFLVPNITGHLLWRTLGGHFTLFGDRDPVRDTQLSYAGLRDPGSITPTYAGNIWGGVVSTSGGVRLDFTGSGGSVFYISGDAGLLRGHHVLDNAKAEGAMEGYLRAGSWPGHGTLTLGAALSGMHYEYNASGLTYGQGGYFSPYYYVAASVPVAFTGHSGPRFHYAVSGAPGVETFEQQWEFFYPLDAALQNAFVPVSGVPCTVAQVAAHTCGQYPISHHTGVHYVASSEASYRFGDHWYLGGFFNANNTYNYNVVSGGFFFRYVFRAQHSSDGYPTGLFPVDGLQPILAP